jgi:hypothetical protein
MMNNSSSVSDIYSVMANNKLGINGLNKVEDNMEIALGFNAVETNNFVIKTTQVSNFEAGTQIYLLDKVENTQTELFPNTSYPFNSEDITNNESRFSLLFKSPSITTGLEQANQKTAVYTNTQNETVIVAPLNSHYAVYNTTGQKIIAGTTEANQTILNNLTKTGVYIVTVTSQGQSKSHRIIVR